MADFPPTCEKILSIVSKPRRGIKHIKSSPHVANAKPFLYGHYTSHSSYQKTWSKEEKSNKGGKSHVFKCCNYGLTFCRGWETMQGGNYTCTSLKNNTAITVCSKKADPTF